MLIFERFSATQLARVNYGTSPYAVCKTCGACIADPAKHDTWHNELTSLLRDHNEGKQTRTDVIEL